ncbi:MAG: aldo/keto reductase [Gemmatimonadota bacterium]|jgi:predicted aldo/keto reductase-like oxidoreductase
MKKDDPAGKPADSISRRTFVKAGGAAVAGGAVVGRDAVMGPGAGPLAGESSHTVKASPFPYRPRQDAKIQTYSTFGRTGFQVSDVGMGSVPLRETSVVRYAYDKGINYFDTAESYGNGAAERAIGEAMQHMEREKVFVATKARIGDGDDTEAVILKVRQCLDRLETDYVDSFSMHAPPSVEALSHPGYHAAIDQLKAEGRVRFRGVSNHGPGMGDILSAAAEDGRFDMMLLVYNFMNHDEGDRILAACKANNVGTTAMKTSPGSLEYEPVDPENLSEEQEQYIERLTGRGRSREQALQQLQAQAARQKETYDNTRPFADQYGIQTQDQLRLGSIHWVIQNPDMHTACISFTEFDLVDKVVPLSGTRLTDPEELMLQQLGLALDRQYCRHGCSACSHACPYEVPVSNIMRYAYYYQGQGREKYAMAKYNALSDGSAFPCLDCRGDCEDACTHGLDIQTTMLQAHALLTLA